MADSLGYGYSDTHEVSTGVNIRSFLSQFSDIFSEFGRHIAPTYQHDRCERCVQMRLYALSKRNFFVVFLVFFSSFSLCLFIGLAGPPITVTTDQNATTLTPKPNNSASGPFYLHTPPLSTYSQQLWLLAQIITKKKDDETFQKSFQVNVMIRGIGKDDTRTVLMGEKNSPNKTRNLECKNAVCKAFTILHLGFLDYPHYIITVRFFDLESTHEKYNITNVRFYFNYYNPSFTKIEIWFRFIFLVITFLLTCWFGHSLRRFFLRDWSIEQKWMAMLLPLLLLYNDPLFPLMFLVNSWVPGMLDAMFQATFLCALLLFWLCIYHGIRQTKRTLISFYAPKLLVVGLLWMSAFTLASWQKYNELQDPTYNYALDINNFLGFKVFFFIIGGLYLLYLVYLIIRAYAELRSMPYFDLRLKFLTTLMLIVLSCTIAITFLRFGAGVLQDNFVADIKTHYKNSAEFMAFYGLLNLYMYTMAYVYSPAKNAVYESHFKDDPTFSMLNDSDDDVIYSEQEESLLRETVPKRIDSDED